MCVTNIAKRQRQSVAVANPKVVRSTPSMVSQRLIGNFMPLMLNTAMPKPASTVPTTISVAAPQQTIPATLNYYPPQDSAPPALEENKRPKRRRKPQKPGKTAKQNDRHFVVHNYHDHSFDPDENDEDEDSRNRRRGGVTISFPMKLHAVLDQVEVDGLAHVVSWSPHGRCFVIHEPKEFVDHVMPFYFRQTKLTSFQRQLNLYGFCRLTRGTDSGGYYHELFLRGKTFLTKKMSRTKVKGTKFKAASSPDQEPDFFRMPPVVVSPLNTSDECSSDERNETRPSIARRRVPGDGVLFPNETASTLYESVSVQVPANPIIPTLDPYPLYTQPSFVSNDSWNNVDHFGMDRSEADHILDEAVEELFSADPVMGDTEDLDELWDTTAFGEDGVQDDTQLGYLLEKFLND